MAIPSSAKLWMTINAVRTEMTQFLASGEGISITNRGRQNSLDDIGPSVLTVTLDNHNGFFTPDNPASPYFPFIAEDTVIELEVTVNGVTSTRFKGRVTSVSPEFYGGVSGLSRVVISAADFLADFANVKFKSFWAEEAKKQLKTAGRYADIWEFDGSQGTKTFINRGKLDPSSSTLYPAEVVSPTNQSDGITWQSSESDGFNSVAVLNPDASGVGPVLLARVQDGVSFVPRRMGVMLKIAEGYVPEAGKNRVLAQFWDASAIPRVLFSLRVVNDSGAVAVQIFNADGTTFGLPLSLGSRAYAWNYLILDKSDDPDNSFLIIFEGSLGYVYSAVSFLDVTHVYLGGNGNPSAPGKTNNCVPGVSFGGMYVAGHTNNLSYLNTVIPATNTNTGLIVTTYLLSFADTNNVGTYIGTDFRRLTFDKIVGQNALPSIQRYAKSCNAIFWVQPNGTTQLIFSDAHSTNTVAYTLNLGEDDDASNALRLSRESDGSPTLVTVTCPWGSVDVTDTGIRRDETVESVCPTPDAAMELGYFVMRKSKALRVSSVSVDLATSVGSGLTAALMSQAPQTRIKIAGFNAKILGYTEAEYFVTGWEEYYNPFSATFTLFTEPATDPPVGELDSAVYGRFGTDTMTCTGGTAVGTTGLGTLILSTPGEPLTVDPADYPLDLDWRGERVTVSSPPASAVSPQTVTLTARGVTPSVARVHTAGEPVDVWMSAHYVF